MINHGNEADMTAAPGQIAGAGFWNELRTSLLVMGWQTRAQLYNGVSYRIVFVHGSCFR